MMKTAEYFQGIDPAAAVGIVHNGWRGFVLRILELLFSYDLFFNIFVGSMYRQFYKCFGGSAG